MKYILSTELLNSYGMRVKTNGIKLPDNDSVPILMNHDVDNILGKWTNFKKDNNELSAEPEWDTEDTDVVKIVNKIEKGFIDGISVGLSIDDYEVSDDDVIDITESTLLEASIATIPANKDARIRNKNNLILTFSYKGEKDMTEIVKELKASVQHNNETKAIKERIAEKEEVKEKKEEVKEKKEEVKEKKPTAKKKVTKKKVTKKVVETKNLLSDNDVDIDSIDIADETVEDAIIDSIDSGEIDLSEDMRTLGDRIIKMFDIKIGKNDNKYSKIILSLYDMSIEREERITSLKNEIITLKENKILNEIEIKELKLSLNKNDIEVYLNDSKRTGKINDTQYNKFLELSLNGNFDTVKEIIEQQTINAVNETKLTGLIDTPNKDNKNKDFEWYQKNDSKYLIELKRNNKDEYDRLVQEFIKNK